MSELRENEQKTLNALKNAGGKGTVEDVMREADLAHAAVMRAALSLETRGLIKVHESKRMRIYLNDEGKRYAIHGLPERTLANTLISLGGEASIDEVIEASNLSRQIATIALGWMIRKGWARIDKENRRLRIIGKPERGLDERVIETINKRGSVFLDELDRESVDIIKTLKRRRIIEVDEEITRELELTDEGWKLARTSIKLIEEVSQLTPEIIRSGRWKEIRIRRFNVEAPGPIIYPGKIHPAQEVIQEIREIFLEMGFTEIRGPIVETAFWNFDALFQPQDHPAREMMDTFYLTYPSMGDLPKEDIVRKVAKTHENGWTTGSTGWGYKWKREEAKRLILRTHTTAVTIKYLAEHKDPPLKVFSIDRVYRNEKVDYKHLAEFHQIEGIVMDRRVTLRDLMGILKEFYSKLGLKKVQFWPSYFPYTEPSAQSTVYIPKLKAWFELCGMGLFRPEVLRPLGIKHPVLAWGGGLERLIMLKLAVDDVRFLYKNDLGWIRRSPICQ